MKEYEVKIDFIKNKDLRDQLKEKGIDEMSIHQHQNTSKLTNVIAKNLLKDISGGAWEAFFKYSKIFA